MNKDFNFRKFSSTTDSRLSLDSPPALPKGREQLLVKAEDVVILLLSGICSLPLGRAGGESRESPESVVLALFVKTLGTFGRNP